MERPRSASAGTPISAAAASLACSNAPESHAAMVSGTSDDVRSSRLISSSAGPGVMSVNAMVRSLLRLQRYTPDLQLMLRHGVGCSDERILANLAAVSRPPHDAPFRFWCVFWNFSVE